MKNLAGFKDYPIGLVINPNGKLAVSGNVILFTVIGFKIKATNKANYIFPILGISSPKR